MDAPRVTSLMDTLGGTLATTDRERNRLNTSHEDRLRQIVQNRLASQKRLSEGLAAQGLSHSSVHLGGQLDIGESADRQMSQQQQRFTDSLTNLAKRRIDAEVGFNINAVMPR